MYNLIYKNDVCKEYDYITENIEEYEESYGKTLTDGDIWDIAYDNIERWLEDEKLNLSDIGVNGVVTIVDLQLWNGTRFGFLFSDNLAEALSNLPIADCTFEWGVNGRDLVGRLWHHDDAIGGTTMIVRQLKDGVTADRLTAKNWRRLTKSVKKPICEVYGW